jgi:hypothetical protein
MAFTYTQIKDQELDSINHLVVRGVNTGTGVECNVYVRKDMHVDRKLVRGESSQSNFFIEGATVSSLISDLAPGFVTLYQYSTDDKNNAKRVIAGAQITQGVIVCPYSITTLRGAPAIAFDEQSYLLPGATISGTDLSGGGAGGTTDANAIHKSTASEIHGITLKALPVGADELLIEDSAAAWAKKRVTVASLGGGGVDEFIELIDCPSSYTGHNQKFVTVVDDGELGHGLTFTPLSDRVSGNNGITVTDDLSGGVSVAPIYGSSANTVCAGNDARLTGLKQIRKLIGPTPGNYDSTTVVSLGSKILSVTTNVLTVFNGSATLAVRVNGSSPLNIQLTVENKLANLDQYTTEPFSSVLAANVGVIRCIVAGTSTVGSAEVIVTYAESFMT